MTLTCESGECHAQGHWQNTYDHLHLMLRVYKMCLRAPVCDQPSRTNCTGERHMYLIMAFSYKRSRLHAVISSAPYCPSTYRPPDALSFNGPLSSVVERVTRNDEVGCSIQPAGIWLFASFFHSHISFLAPTPRATRNERKKKFGILYNFTDRRNRHLCRRSGIHVLVKNGTPCEPTNNKKMEIAKRDLSTTSAARRHPLCLMKWECWGLTSLQRHTTRPVHRH